MWYSLLDLFGQLWILPSVSPPDAFYFFFLLLNDELWENQAIGTPDDALKLKSCSPHFLWLSSYYIFNLFDDRKHASARKSERWQIFFSQPKRCLIMTAGCDLQRNVDALSAHTQTLLKRHFCLYCSQCFQTSELTNRFLRKRPLKKHYFSSSSHCSLHFNNSISFAIVSAPNRSVTP